MSNSGFGTLCDSPLDDVWMLRWALRTDSHRSNSSQRKDVTMKPGMLLAIVKRVWGPALLVSLGATSACNKNQFGGAAKAVNQTGEKNAYADS